MALDGKRLPAGPAGAPQRGRRDVLPTGRNLFTADPRLHSEARLVGEVSVSVWPEVLQEQHDWDSSHLENRSDCCERRVLGAG